VKRSGEQWRLRDHVAFFSYRWLAWIVAALTLTLPGLGGALPRDAGLLLLIGVITVTATALAQSYVRLLRQRPPLLALDLAACAAILWLSDSSVLPFLPYALGALVLPALTFGWRGALLGAASFTALDSFGLSVINPAAGQALDAPAIAVRLIVPFAFASAWAVAGRLLQREPGAAPPRAARQPALVGATGDQPERMAARRTPAPRVASLSRGETPPGMPTSLATTTPLLIARSGAEPRDEPPRRVLYDVPSRATATLAAALEQLAAAAAEQSGHEVRAHCQGTPRPLNAAQHAVLLRVAQEGLLNVQQHAHASSAVVTLSYEPRAVTLSVQDNGVGLLDGTYERPGLHALRALRYRLVELDGQLAVFEGESGGLTLRATVPLD
jgi:hypothetical protein